MPTALWAIASKEASWREVNVTTLDAAIAKVKDGHAEPLRWFRDHAGQTVGGRRSRPAGRERVWRISHWEGQQFGQRLKGTANETDYGTLAQMAYAITAQESLVLRSTPLACQPF